VREEVKLLVDGLSTKSNLSAWSFVCLSTHRGVDLSHSTLRFLSGLLTARRCERGTRWRRLSAGRQALLVLAHLRCGHTYTQLAAGFGVGTTTAYRNVAEDIEILATRASDLATAIWTAASKAFVILDGTVRHEALDDRAGVKGPRHRAVAAVRLKLRAA
jgi:hypothetical protein